MESAMARFVGSLKQQGEDKQIHNHRAKDHHKVLPIAPD
jgi:hypothetical protein